MFYDYYFFQPRKINWKPPPKDSIIVLVSLFDKFSSISSKGISKYIIIHYPDSREYDLAFNAFQQKKTTKRFSLVTKPTVFRGHTPNYCLKSKYWYLGWYYQRFFTVLHPSRTHQVIASLKFAIKYQNDQLNMLKAQIIKFRRLESLVLIVNNLRAKCIRKEDFVWWVFFHLWAR